MQSLNRALVAEERSCSQYRNGLLLLLQLVLVNTSPAQDASARAPVKFVLLTGCGLIEALTGYDPTQSLKPPNQDS